MRNTLLLLSALMFPTLTNAQADQTWIDLDGVNDYLDLGAAPLLAGRSAFTVEMRVHFDDVSGEFTLIGQRISDPNRTLVVQRWSGALYILFSGSNYASCPFEPCIGDRNHLAVAYDGAGATNEDRLQFYLNGVEQTLAFTGTIPDVTLVTSPAANLVLGCEHNGSMQLQYFDGQFGEVCFWDRALSAGEIGARLTHEVVGNESGLLEHFGFANGTPGGNNTAISSIPGGSGLSSITPMNMALTGAGSNFIGAPVLTGGINVSVVVNGAVLTAAAGGATYQWLNCESGFTPVTGAMSQSFTATTNGTYAVRITQGACSDTSACISISSVGMAALEAAQWTMYPNPAAEVLVIEPADNARVQPYRIVDPLGRVVRTGSVIGRTVVPVAHLASGIHLLQVGVGQTRGVKAFVKE